MQVFNSNGTFHHQNDSKGAKPGQFNIPISVCSDVSDRVVVVDKNNHRIQIFTVGGDFFI